MGLKDILGFGRTSLASYATAIWPGFELAAHHKAIINRLEQVESGNKKRVMLFLPPRHGKSLLSSQVFPAWFLGKHPTSYIMIASYSQELADGWGRRVRNFILDPKHQSIFPECRMSADSSAANRFSTTRGGEFYALGVGSPATGRGADALILDDLIRDAAEAKSETIRRNLWDWYTHVAYPRLQPGARIVLVTTRWHESDLAGRLLAEQGAEWDVLSLPAIAEENDPLGREVGDALWPSHYPLNELLKIREAIGSQAFISLYQQRPSAAEGSIFKRAWFQTYGELPPKFKRIVQAWGLCIQNRQGE